MSEFERFIIYATIGSYWAHLFFQQILKAAA